MKFRWKILLSALVIAAALGSGYGLYKLILWIKTPKVSTNVIAQELVGSKTAEVCVKPTGHELLASLTNIKFDLPKCNNKKCPVKCDGSFDFEEASGKKDAATCTIGASNTWDVTNLKKCIPTLVATNPVPNTTKPVPTEVVPTKVFADDASNTEESACKTPVVPPNDILKSLNLIYMPLEQNVFKCARGKLYFVNADFTVAELASDDFELKWTKFQKRTCLTGTTPPKWSTLKKCDVHDSVRGGLGYIGQMRTSGVGKLIGRDRFGVFVYQGHFKDYFFDGIGKLVSGNGGIYQGMFQKSMMHGQGKFTSGKSGNIYKGTFQNNKMHEGKYTYVKSGDIYEGQFQNNKKHGKGKYTWKASGDVYEGGFQNNKMHEHGTITPKDGEPFAVHHMDGVNVYDFAFD
eukprot:856586_1